MESIEWKLQELKETLLSNIEELFDKYKKKDTSGDMSIQSGDISDESLYLLCGFEPEWNDDIDDNVLFPCEIIEFLDNKNEIYVRTFEKGSINIRDLELDDLMRCYDYLSVLEDNNETKE